MPVSIVVGGQYGSEGKGKVAHYLAREMNASFVVRCGGPNSGHTVIDEQGNARIFQQLPTAAILPDVKLAICAGSYIDLDVLFREIDETNLDSGRLWVDRDAVIITNELKAREAESGLVERIGSTGSGTGAAVAARANREPSLLFAKDIPELSQFMADVPEILRDALDQRERVVIEGTQGFGLSPLHSRHYPNTTSRDTTAASFVSEAGLSPLDVDDIVLVLRAHPIRVDGKSGPLPAEIDWDTVTLESGNSRPLMEYTSVSNKVRRIARFHPDIVKKALTINKATTVVLNHLDYIDAYWQHGNIVTDRVKHFVEKAERIIGVTFKFLGFGPNILIQRKESLSGVGSAQTTTKTYNGALLYRDY